MATAAPVIPVDAASAIPVDLFISKKHPGLNRGERGFADSSGNIVYKAKRVSSKFSPCKRVLLDASGNTLISMCRQDNGSWQGFKGGEKEKNLTFRVQRTLKKFNRTVLEVFFAGENAEESTADFKVRGCAFQRSCTISSGNSIVAETSLMHKLNEIFVGRSKFRLTIFPGSVDHTLIAALIVIFLD